MGFFVLWSLVAFASEKEPVPAEGQGCVQIVVVDGGRKHGSDLWASYDVGPHGPHRSYRADAEGKILFCNQPRTYFITVYSRKSRVFREEVMVKVVAGQTTTRVVQVDRSHEVSETSRAWASSHLSRLPVARSVDRAIALMPGVGMGAGGPQLAGSAANEVSWRLDGLDVTDRATGGPAWAPIAPMPAFGAMPTLPR